MTAVVNTGIAKKVFIGLSSLSLCCLTASFARPLQGVEVWRTAHVDAFKRVSSEIHVFTDTDIPPYGFDRHRATKVAQIYETAKGQKILLLALAVLSAGIDMIMSDEILKRNDIDQEIKTIDQSANKKILLSKVKHKWEMLSEAQKQQFREEFTVLKDMEITREEVSAERTKVNYSDKFINAKYLHEQGTDTDTVVTETWNLEKGSKEHQDAKRQFEAWLTE